MTKRLCAMLLTLVMLLPVSVITASAIPGAGAESTTYRAYGCDLSFWNVGGSTLDYSLVDFARMKADGCEFAILRIGFEGSATRVDTLDEAFVQYYKNAREAGMPLGVYFYSLALTYEGAKQDAEWVMGIIEQYDMYFEYPIYYDVEDSNQTSLDADSMTQLCLGWCETLEAKGYFPGIYGGDWGVVNQLPSSFTERYDLWFPKVNYNNPETPYEPDHFDFSPYYGMWQYAWSGHEYDGIGLDMLDVNVAYKDYPTIMATYGYNNCAGLVDKSDLKGLISGTVNVSPKDYSVQSLETIRIAYDAAVEIDNDTSATQEQVDAAAEALKTALNNTSTKNILSTGKTYTSSCTTTGAYADDGVCLTNGTKGTLDGSSAAYVSFGESAEIVVDLGSVQRVDTFTTYFAAGMWYIHAPSEVYVSIFVSSDNVNFTNVASSSAEIVTNGSNVYDSTSWTQYTITATADSQVDARYVRFAIANNDSVNDRCIWIDEVEVGCYTGDRIKNSIYVSTMNKTVGAGETVLFTSAYNDGVVSGSYANGNISWTQNVLAKKNSDGTYTVTSNEVGTGDASKSYTLASDEILIASHGWEGSVENPVGDSLFNFNRLAGLTVGTTINLSGINVDENFHNIAAYISPILVNDGDIESDVPQLEGGKSFWLTHYNDNTVEGAGVIFTEAYTGAAWWLHIAFAPVESETENVYEIVAISDGTDVGDGVAQDIPEGGFVYALNLGNDWPTINGDGTGIDYTSPNCNNAVADALTWKVGDKLKISGLNLEEKTIPTTTASTKWYDDAYVCTANYAYYVEHATDDGLYGDVDNDGDIDQFDYLLVKRFYFNTYDLTEDEAKRADVDHNNEVDQMDYLYIKRHYFGTYVIVQK